MEFPADIKKDAEEAVSGFMGWVDGGNTTASLSEHAVAGLKHSFASAILAERERCAKVALTMPLLKTSGLVGSEISICEMGQDAAYEATAVAIMNEEPNGK